MNLPASIRESTRPVAVVLGLGQNGMATARALGREHIPVVGVDTDLDQAGARTRYAVKVHCPDFLTGGPGLVQTLVDLGRALPHRGVLFPSGDLNQSVVSEHRETLGEHYHIAMPPKDVNRMFLNKKMFYQFAMERGFPLPQTVFPADREHVDRVAPGFKYPVLIKPFQPNAEWRRTFDTRLFVADSPDALRALYDRLAQVHADLIMQEYMPGPDSELWWGVSYLDAGGRPLATWTGRKLRQYPRRFGTATLAESRWDPWVARQATTILQAMGHRGYGVVEFKRDRRDNQFKITEVTGGRTWFPHSLVTRSGINLPLIWYRDALGLPVETPTSYREGIKWIHEERDLKTVMLYFLPEGEVTLWSWLQSYRGRRVYAYAAWDDPGPILNSLSRVATAARRRLWRRLRSVNVERARHAGKKPKHMEELLLAADPTVGRTLRRVDFE